MRVRGSMKTVPSIEVNKDTVYIRTNITQITEDDFVGWEYDELQYDLKEYIKNLTTTQDSQSMAMLLSLLMSEMDFINQRLDVLEEK